jgi:D-alanyl-D-alanine dipeptidase
MNDMLHATGKSVDIALVNYQTQEPVYMYDHKRDGDQCWFLNFYEDESDEHSAEMYRLQTLLGKIMLQNGFQYGTKNEVFHFDHVGIKKK